MYEKILVGTDGSPTAAKAVDRAVAFAQSAGAALTILSAGRPDKGEKVVAAEAARHAASGVAIDTRVVQGDAVEELVKAASAGGYDLLVTGNKGLTGLRRLAPVGRVPAKVAHHLPCSFLVVKTT